MVARSVPAKRKQAADMPESPPKRVTRARAVKATNEPDVKPKSTKVTTASAKAGAAKKKAAATAPAKMTKRKTRADDNTSREPPAADAPQQMNEERASTEMEQPKPRQRKTTKTAEAKAPNAAATKSKGRQAKTTTPPAEAKITKTRGRSRTVASDADDERQSTYDKVDDPEPAPVKSTTTRGRAAAKAAPKTTRAIAATHSTATKKKVQFQDEQDKENIPMETEASMKPARKATGMKAKPVRKAAASKPSTGGRKATKKDEAGSESAKTSAAPLSPKKVTQVAKTPSSSEDELASEKTPVKSPSKTSFNSPFKSLTSPAKSMGSPNKPIRNTNVAPSSPLKQMNASVLTSPAKRLPQSPFKDSMKSPAKRFDIGENVSKSLFTSQANSPSKASLLQESPKKVIMADVPPQPVLQASQSPFKKSLLQSPPRRPFGSHMKVITPSANGSPMRQRIAEPVPVKSRAITTDRMSPPRATREDSAEEGTNTTGGLDPEQDMMEIDANDEMSTIPVAAPRPEFEAPSPSINLGEQFDFPVERDMQPEIHEPMEEQPESVFNFQGPPFSISSTDYRRTSRFSQLSEDELASPEKRFAPTPLKSKAFFASDVDNTPFGQRETAELTPLADKLSGWTASSPSKQRPSRQQRGIFSLAGNQWQHEVMDAEIEQVEIAPTALQTSFFEDDMAILNAGQPTPDRPSHAPEQSETDLIGVSMESATSQEYGDENAVPTEAEIIRAEQEANDPTLTCTPAKVFTPAKKVAQQPRQNYTVSKVPLKSSVEISPLKLPRQRSKSLGGALSVLVDNIATENEAPERPLTPTLDPVAMPQTPSSGMELDSMTPGRNGRKRGSSDVLKGAVVYVDVHTSEGADASGIFVDLLTQMGARCVKQWNWNPRASLGDVVESDESPQGASPATSKVGITHVVYKDGGVRTLDKVRQSNGVVTCVGVGWVLDCEREENWLNEASYLIDTLLIPRGGHRRRKSMEPRALANLEGTLIPAPGTTLAKPAISPTKEFLTFNTPASRRDTFNLDVQQVTPEEADELSGLPSPAQATPTAVWKDALDAEMGGSPTTPYYLSKGAELVQRTCPPKQRGVGLFPVTGNVEDQSDEQVRQRLMIARRRTLQWGSKTKSPLGRVVSYGK